MNKLKKQQEITTNLLKLISENPELEILPMVDCDCIQDDSFSRYLSQWGKAEIDYYYGSEERIYFKSYDFEELVDEFIENNFEKEEYKGLSDEFLNEVAEKEVESYEWIKAIIVNIDPN